DVSACATALTIAASSTKACLSGSSSPRTAPTQASTAVTPMMDAGRYITHLFPLRFDEKQCFRPCPGSIRKMLVTPIRGFVGDELVLAPNCLAESHRNGMMPPREPVPRRRHGEDHLPDHARGVPRRRQGYQGDDRRSTADGRRQRILNRLA